MVFAARLTQQGHKIASMDDLMELYEKSFSVQTVAAMGALPHPTIQKFAVITVAIVGASRRFLAQITRHQNEVKFMSASLQYSNYTGQADFAVPYSIMTAPAVVQELYLKSCNESMKCYEALCTAGSGHDAAGYATPQGLRNVLLISATPYQWKHIIGQRVCRRNTDETRIVLLKVWKKEPEPGAVRKGTSQPELDARSHEEVIPRNDAAEKQNEIPGRQIPSQTDPLVEIRSAVHSNYAGMVAMLGADNRVYLGREERCHYQNMQPSYYDNQDGSLCFVCDQPDMYYFLYGEGWAHTQAEMLERGLTLRQYEEFARLQNGVLAQFTTQREILFAGQPFQAPESYLRNAELYEEGQTGNYNMLDGRLNNEPPVRPDLTDGQTDEEIRELVPEAKPSLMDRLKADKPEHEARQMIPPVPERER